MRYHNAVLRKLALPALLILSLSGCSSSRYSQHQDSAPDTDIDVSQIPNPVPRAEPRSRYGNPDSYVVNGKRYHVMASSQDYHERGIASWYGKKFHGHRTSSGETYDMYQMTAAHKSLPLPTYVEVTNLRNQRRVIVRVNDRGPFHHNRIIDLSYAAAKKLGITGHGTGMVEIRAIDPHQPQTPARQYAQSSPAKKSLGNPLNQPKNNYRLFLQVGAFSSRDNAEQLRSRLLAQMDSLTINTGYSEEKNIYRVRIGPLASVEQADAITNRITNLGFDEPHIVLD